jgi:hypothetical protein
MDTSSRRPKEVPAVYRMAEPTGDRRPETVSRNPKSKILNPAPWQGCFSIGCATLVIVAVIAFVLLIAGLLERYHV